MIVRDCDNKNVLKDLIRVLERASFETCAFIEIRLELREINELLTELYKIPDTNEAEPQTDYTEKCHNCKRIRECGYPIVGKCEYEPQTGGGSK